MRRPASFGRAAGVGVRCFGGGGGAKRGTEQCIVVVVVVVVVVSVRAWYLF
jgi:hypothetical protein